MRLSWKFSHLLGISVLAERMNHFHFVYKLRKQPFKDYGVTLKCICYFQYGRFWRSYYAEFDGSGEGYKWEKQYIDIENSVDELVDRIQDIFLEFGSCLEYLEDIFFHDFTLSDLPDPDEEEAELDAFLFGKGLYSASQLDADDGGDDDIIF